MSNQPQLKQKFLEYFAKLPIQKLAADYIGKSEDTICDWKNADPEFSNQIATAKSEWALDKVGKVRSKEWLLERIMKDHFAPRSPLLDETGKPIPILGGISNVHTDNSAEKAS